MGRRGWGTLGTLVRPPPMVYPWPLLYVHLGVYVSWRTFSGKRPADACQPDERERGSRGVRQKGTPPRGASRGRCIEDCIKWAQEVRREAVIVSTDRLQPSICSRYEGGVEEHVE